MASLPVDGRRSATRKVCAVRWCLEVITHPNTSQQIDILRRIVSTLLLCFLCAAFGVAQDTKLLPPSQAVAPAIASAHSGPKPSGAGKRWSNWYHLGVGKAPNGYTVQKTEFWLSGDHVCGASAECREIARDDRQVIWEFRLQGHDHTDTARTTYSEGHIRVFYNAR